MTNITPTTHVTHSAERTWTGSMLDWNAHSFVIKHWCDGGDVDYYTGSAWGRIQDPEFLHTEQYRIAERKPQPGEVWILDENPFLYIRVSDDYHWQSPDGQDRRRDGIHKPKYAAPNVLAYAASCIMDEVSAFEGFSDLTPMSQAEVIADRVANLAAEE